MKIAAKSRNLYMPLEPFKISQALSLGVELELQLVSLSDFDLTQASPDLLELLTYTTFPGNVTPEITESMIEISTDIHTQYSTLSAQLIHIRDAIVQAGERLNVGVCGGGTHPFQMWSEQKIFPKTRYQKTSALYGYLAKQFTVFGQHIHVGCVGGNDALFLLHALNRYVPHFIALSASSPFVQNRDTRFDSARLNSISAFPLSGRAPFFLDWLDFERQYFEKIEHTGIANSMKDFYWDIRPKPEFGTIELRVCDTPLSVDRAAALACYLQTLCAYLLAHQDQQPVEDDYLVYQYNRFQACRFGLEGVLVHPKTYEQIALREDLLNTLRCIQPYSGVLGSELALEHIAQITRTDNDAQYLRQQFTQLGNVESVVNAALKKFSAHSS